MQSGATIDRFRSPMVIRAINRFGAMLNGKVSKRIPPEELIETAKRRANLSDFGDGDFREPLGRLLESCWQDARLNVIGNIALRSDVLRILRNRLLLQRDRSLRPEIAQHPIMVGTLCDPCFACIRCEFYQLVDILFNSLSRVRL